MVAQSTVVARAFSRTDRASRASRVFRESVRSEAEKSSTRTVASLGMVSPWWSVVPGHRSGPQVFRHDREHRRLAPEGYDVNPIVLFRFPGGRCRRMICAGRVA